MTDEIECGWKKKYMEAMEFVSLMSSTGIGSDDPGEWLRLLGVLSDYADSELEKWGCSHTRFRLSLCEAAARNRFPQLG